jgi:Putative transposase
VCPSCNAKRAHVTAVHLVERVLPHVPYRQWTLSFPHRVQWVLLKVGSALQVTPHFHSLVPDGVFLPWEGSMRFEPLPPPTQAEVEQPLRVVRHRVLRLLEKRGALPAQGGCTAPTPARRTAFWPRPPPSAAFLHQTAAPQEGSHFSYRQHGLTLKTGVGKLHP